MQFQFQLGIKFGLELKKILAQKMKKAPEALRNLVENNSYVKQIKNIRRFLTAERKKRSSFAFWFWLRL